MKRLVLTGIATLAFALGALAQGSINLDNSAGIYGFCVNGPGNGPSGVQANWYTGTMGLEIWEANVAAIPAGINSTSTAKGTGQAAYIAMTTGSTKFNLETTLTGLSVVNSSLSYGQVNMPDVSPAGGTVVIGLAAWNTTATSWANMLKTYDANTRAGVVAFVNGTANYQASPPPTPTGITGWDTSAAQDLIMTAVTVPEPSTFALAGLGAAALLIFRRRK